MTQIINGVQILPGNNIWNTPVDSLPVHPNSDAYIAGIGGLSAPVDPHMDTSVTGLPFNLVNNSTPTYSMSFTFQISNVGPYPIPSSPLIEQGSDLHYIALNTQTGMLYEIFDLTGSPGTYAGGSGAVFDLSSNTLHPVEDSSADGVGLPMLPGIINYPETLTGNISHALRCIISQSSPSYVWPARFSSGHAVDTNPPAGLRLRLKASKDISGFSKINRTILTALKIYGCMVADNSDVTSLRFNGTPDSRWNRTDLLLMNALTANDFEAVDVSSLMIDPNSGATPGRWNLLML